MGLFANTYNRLRGWRAPRELTVWQLILIEGGLNEEYKTKLLTAPFPHSLCGVNFPKDLNFLTLADLEELQMSEKQSFERRILSVCKVVLHVTDRKKVMRARARDVCALLRFTSEECARISGVFASIKRPFTEDEIAAGIKDLNFGLFGVADWYAQRMGITNHEDAEKTPWLRIYKCMEMDYKTREVNRSLVERERKKAEQRARNRRR